jgi:hypothetical protein
MSLIEVLQEKDQKKRQSILSDYLKYNNLDILNDEDYKLFIEIFEIFYTVEENEEKFNKDDIKSVKIDLNLTYRTKQFMILVNDQWYPTSIKRLSGNTKSKNLIISTAFRNSIIDQIYEFKKNNPLNPFDECPINKGLLHCNAQVDHEKPFNIILKEYLNKNKDDIYYYDINKQIYLIKEPLKWQKFHFEKAKLRWVSKEGNKTAHLLYRE